MCSSDIPTSVQVDGSTGSSGGALAIATGGLPTLAPYGCGGRSAAAGILGLERAFGFAAVDAAFGHQPFGAGFRRGRDEDA